MLSWCTICIIYTYIYMKTASLIPWIIAILASLLKLSFSSQQNKSILWWPLECVSGCKKAVNIPPYFPTSLPNHSILRPRTETLEEYHVAHGDGSDRDVGTCTWRVTLEGLISSKLGFLRNLSAPSSAYVINKFNWKQINLPTSFNIFQAHELLHPWNQGILSCFFFPLDHDPPDKQPKSTALVWVHLQKLQPNKTNTGTNHFYDLKKIMAHFIFFGIFNHFYTNFLMAHFISSFFLLGFDKLFVVL